MKTSQEIDKIAFALASAQGQMQNPEKNRTARIKTKAGPEYSYKFADLPSVYDCTRKVLSNNELAHIATIEERDSIPFMVMRLIHSSGQWFESEILLSGEDDKTLAASQTFCRRYLFMGLTGTAGDEDTDGPAEGNYTDCKSMPSPSVKPVPTPTPAAGFSPVMKSSREDVSMHAARVKWKLDEVKLYMIGAFNVGSVDRLTKDQVTALKDTMSLMPFADAIKTVKVKTPKTLVNEDAEPTFDESV